MWNIMLGFAVSFLGYLSPVSNVMHVVIAAITADMLIGLWASRKQGKGWESKKMWRTVTKITLAVIVISLLFAMDTEMGVDAVQTHKIVAWLITGFEMWSILENAAKISDHRIFRILKQYMHDRIEVNTGLDIDKPLEDEQNKTN